MVPYTGHQMGIRSLVFSALACLLLIAAPGNAAELFRYTVKKGDTLGAIAKRYKVTVRQIRVWNNLKSSRIKVGQKLRLRKGGVYRSTNASKRSRVRRVANYVVRKGDSLRAVARRYKMSLRRICALNRRKLGPYTRCRTRGLRTGRTLRVERFGPANLSKCVGSPRRGKLVNGELLPRGRGYNVLRPKRTYGANKTITLLTQCLPKVRRIFPRTPDLPVGSISRKGGGHMSPHRSHQNGLDVDIGYYHKGRKAPRHLKVATAKTLDVPRTWCLLEGFLNTGEVDLIFVDHALQKPLYEYAKKLAPCHGWNKRARKRCRTRRYTRKSYRCSTLCSKRNQTRRRYKVRKGDSLSRIARRFGVTIRQIKTWNRLRSNRIRRGKRLWIGAAGNYLKWLKEVFQYPDRKARGIIRHSRSHHHHFHIRFKSPPGTKKKQSKVKSKSKKKAKGRKSKR